ncbi:MAG: phosphatase PAP2 family protein [Alphaproteobacteria bacterium]|nr:phosphatase PAP2 family protein [Alphaproteobacteria bacterium]
MPRSTPTTTPCLAVLLASLWAAPALADDDPWGTGGAGTTDDGAGTTDDGGDSADETAGTPWDPDFQAPPASPPPATAPAAPAPTPLPRPDATATHAPPPTALPRPEGPPPEGPPPEGPPPVPLVQSPAADPWTTPDTVWTPSAPPPPTAMPTAPPPMPVMPAPPGLGYATREACRAAWQEDRGWVQRLVPTWEHPTLPRCHFADGARVWHLDRRADRDSRPALVLNGPLELGVVVLTGSLVAADLALPDIRQTTADNWDSEGAVSGTAGTDAQRRDGLAMRTSPNRGSARASDLLLGGAWLGTVASPVILPERNGRLTNTVVMFETMALNQAVTQLTKDSVAEPRPLAFQDLSTWTDDDFAWAAETLSSDSAFQSYFSGHTSNVAAFTYGWTTIQVATALEREDDRAGLYLLLYPLAFTVSSLEGSLRVDALKHDPADVAIGHLTGAIIGTGVPFLHHGLARAAHQRDARRRLLLTPTVGPGALGLSGSW